MLINTRLLERADLGALEHILASHYLDNFKIYHRNNRNVQTATVLSAVSLLTFNLGLNSLQQSLWANDKLELSWIWTRTRIRESSWSISHFWRRCHKKGGNSAWGGEKEKEKEGILWGFRLWILPFNWKQTTQQTVPQTKSCYFGNCDQWTRTKYVRSPQQAQEGQIKWWWKFNYRIIKNH